MARNAEFCSIFMEIFLRSLQIFHSDKLIKSKYEKHIQKVRYHSLFHVLKFSMKVIHHLLFMHDNVLGIPHHQ